MPDFLGLSNPIYCKSAQNPANVIKFTTSSPPTHTDNIPGTLGYNSTLGSVYMITAKSGSTATWVALGGGASAVATLSGDTGTATPSAGNIQIAGTGLEIVTAASGSTVTIGIPDTFSIGSTAGANSAVIFSGTGGITLTATNGAVTINSGTAVMNIATAPQNSTVNFATGGGSGIKILTIGSVFSTSSTTIQAGTGGLVAGAATGNTTIGVNAGTNATTLTAGTGAVNCETDFNLTAVATKISMNGGAATDFIGTVTLSSGVATVLNSNIAAGDRISLTNNGINGSTALGLLTYVVTPATNFVITSRNPTDATTQTNDNSIVSYVIVRQT